MEVYEIDLAEGALSYEFVLFVELFLDEEMVTYETS